ncbi:SMP-30/gluconolactonase/LRE family protein [Sphingomonas soli]|uniref:SMP-30/gluconolactonase/LRE family protein n=1 Tax=Sphingomonas soli TaxID=266127 RepID=UPI00082E7A80|nr:SMP-30/gluconolactonase/LRE family protein [Sphingomonas soli]
MIRTTRRAVLAGIAAAPFVPGLAQAETVGSITKFDPAFDAVVDANAPIEVLGTGYRWAEGPVWVKQGGYLLFNDPPSNVCYQWKPGGQVTEFLRPSGLAGPIPAGVREAGANGMAIDAQGDLVIADSGTRAVARIDLKTRQKTIIADRYQGKRFSSVNDLTIGRGGMIYFTDPPYGFEKGDDSPLKETAFNGLYRVPAAGGEVSLIDGSMKRPNGVALSPDLSRLYVAQSDPDRPEIRVYDLAADGSAMDEGRLFADFRAEVAAKLPGLPDGLKVDAAGRIFATGPGGVYVLSPEGKKLGRIATGKAIANCCFGEDGKTLFLTSHDMVAKVRLKAKGW